MGKVYKSMIELIGKTPILELCNYNEKVGAKAKILAKLECFNPAGSSKDRIALAIIEEAQRTGKLKKGGVIIEPTSGNTGIGIAAVAKTKGYKAILTMPETMSEERRNLLKAYGADLVLTDGDKGMEGAVEKAKELNETIPGSFLAGQFVNPINAYAHEQTTGPEIWEDTDGLIDTFIACVGTGGTITGTGRYLKKMKKSIEVIAVEPLSSPLLSKGIAGKHKIQGIGANFIPEVLDMDIYDKICCVSDQQAYDTAKKVADCEGILVGISSGAALYAATIEALKDENAGKNIVIIMPDSGERYLSTELFK